MTQERIGRYSPQAFRTVLTLMSASAAMMAQTGGGATLVGTVKDSTGSVVAQAKVTVINTATNLTTETSTAADGGYYVPYLTPGDYRVKDRLRTISALRWMESPQSRHTPGL